MAIKVLDQLTINKIAAGEVIERPSSVVKELVENAIDAKASAITIEIKEGGISFIRITDNGGGFEKEDIPVAFLRHSTSKIKSVEDLLTVSSLGFRGEALSSISAVAQVELVTKTHDSLMGTRYIIEGGREKEIEAVGCPDGTTFLIRNLFFNTPARRKFLKSPVTEAGYIAELVEKLAMSHPDISFRFINNGQNKIHSSGNGNMKDIIYHVYGRDINANLLPVHYRGEGFSIDGFIGKPIINRGNRNYENYYINGRYIRSNIINKAIEDAYKPFMMQHKYPFTALHFQVDHKLIDVNVHPTKMELRFSNGQEIYDAVLKALTDALTHKEFIPDVGLDSTNEKSESKKATKNPEKHIPEPFEKNRMQMVREPALYEPKPQTPKTSNWVESLTKISVEKPSKPQIPKAEVKKEVSVETKKDSGEFTSLAPQTVEKPEGVKKDDVVLKAAPAVPQQMTLFEEKLLDEKNVIRHKIIGQVFDTYWIVEFEDKMYLIDQHAAHEKVLYERIMARFKESKADSQNLMPAVVVTLSLNDIEVLKENFETFHAFGYEVEAFGGQDYAITAVPLELYGLNEKDVFLEILDELAGGSYKTITSLTDRMATIACKAAVKGNNHLSVPEAKELINELLTLENPYNCPHGRPTIVSMSKYEMEKKFKRIV
ncbi:MAG: DNA mismatch repair endonuclease MutL [Lachnospiraceae bacterium]